MNPDQPTDTQISVNRIVFFLGKQNEFEKQGCTEEEAKYLAHRHLWYMERTEPHKYVKRRDRKPAGLGLGEESGKR